MYDTFMLIAGIIFVILAIVDAFVLVLAFEMAYVASQEQKFYRGALAELKQMHDHYEDAIERSNETVVEKFRHDLDCHAGENSK